MNDMKGNPKKNRTRVNGLVSNTDDHCATATGRQFLEFFNYLSSYP